MLSLFRSLMLLPLVLVLLGTAARAQRSPSEVLLVYNTNSPISTAIGKDYMAKRHVRNVVKVQCADSALTTANETIAYADYTQEIATPIQRYLATHQNINFIVLTKGVPLRVNGALTGDGAPGPLQASLDSALAAIDYPTIPGAVKANLAGSGTVGTGWINRYYNATVPFTHAKFGGYLVTRLDGYTQADAMGLVRQALLAEHTHFHGKILFDVQSDFGVGDKATQPLVHAPDTVTEEAPYGTWNADMLHASDILEASGIPHETDITQPFIGDRSHLLGYYSWGSNDSHFAPDAYESLQFAPGSICDTAVSTSGRTFLPTTGGQTLMADLIAHGLTCCQGYTDEPILDGISSPTIDLSRYLSGWTMAESFYAGTRYIGWVGVCVGDPLCCPYAGQKLTVPVLACSYSTAVGGPKPEPCTESGQNLGYIANGSYTAYRNVNLTGVNRFMARIATPGPGGKIEIHLDSPHGTRIGTCLVPVTGDWQGWRTVTCNLTKKTKGIHKLYLVYRGGQGGLFNFEWFALRR